MLRPISGRAAARALITLLAVLGAGAATGAAQTAWQPAKPVAFVVDTALGGGSDQSARVMQKIWRDHAWLGSVAVVNKVGGSGALAHDYILRHPGDAHYIAAARMALLTNRILGRSSIHYTDMTPLALMSSLPAVLAVRADSPFRTLGDLAARLQADPRSVSIAVGNARGSPAHFAVALLARGAGVDAKKLKVVTFGAVESVTHVIGREGGDGPGKALAFTLGGGGGAGSNLLGGHVDVMSAPADDALAHYRSGAMRVLGIAAARRNAGMPSVPTMREQGYDVVIGDWWALMAPAGLAPPHIAYWEEVLERTARHAQWRRQLEAAASEGAFLKSRPTRDFLQQEYERARALLVETGMVQ